MDDRKWSRCSLSPSSYDCDRIRHRTTSKSYSRHVEEEKLLLKSQKYFEGRSFLPHISAWSLPSLGSLWCAPSGLAACHRAGLWHSYSIWFPSSDSSAWGRHMACAQERPTSVDFRSFHSSQCKGQSRLNSHRQSHPRSLRNFQKIILHA